MLEIPLLCKLGLVMGKSPGALESLWGNLQVCFAAALIPSYLDVAAVERDVQATQNTNWQPQGVDDGRSCGCGIRK